MRRIWLGLLFLGWASGCPRGGGPIDTPPVAPDVADPGHAPPADDAPAHHSEPEQAAAPDRKAVLAAAQAAAKTAGLTGTTKGPGAPLGATVPGYKRYEGSWYPAPKLPPSKTPYLIDQVRTEFEVAPWSTIEGGDLVVRFTTRVPTGTAALFSGLRLEEDLLAPPRYREYVAENRTKPGRTHELRMPLADLLSPRKDVHGVGKRGWGEVVWRVECELPGSGSTALREGRQALAVSSEGARALPTVTLGPMLHQVSDTRAIVSFETDVPTTAAVAVGSTLATDAEPSTRHEVQITGLAPNTRYPYLVAVSDGSGTSTPPPRTLTTGGGDGPTVVAILSDSRSGVGSGLTAFGGVNAFALQPLVLGAYRHGAQAMFFPGDLIDGYVAHDDDFIGELRTWLSVVEPVQGQVPIYTSMGNHDVVLDVWNDGVVFDKAGDRSSESRFAAVMVNPGGAPPPEAEGAPPYDETVYAVDLGPAHFVVLNTNYWYTRQPGHERLGGKGNREGLVMSGQLDWLDADLTDARERGVQDIVVLGHEPAFPVGGHTKDGMWWNGKIPEVNAARERLWRILSEHEAIAYVSGDEHNYSRTLIGGETVPDVQTPVFSVITGGSGAPYYALDPPPEYADRVITFSAQQHYTLWTFDEGKAPHLTVYGITGAVIEDLDLTR